MLTNITGDKIMIMDMNKNVMFIVNPKDKSYVETTLPLDMSKLMPKEAAPDDVDDENDGQGHAQRPDQENQQVELQRL